MNHNHEDPRIEIPCNACDQLWYLQCAAEQMDFDVCGWPITVIFVADEVVGAYIAWGGRARLQITQTECCYVETDGCEAGAY